MYTRCPSCRAELSFAPPANMESLPEGHKHRIKCPHCGVIIGVKINKIDVAATYPYAPGPYQSANQFAPNATYPNGGYAPINTPAAPGFDNTAADAKPAKKTGISRNIFMLIFSLGFVMLAIMGYLVQNGTIALLEGTEGWGKFIVYFDGLKGWETLCTDFETFKSFFSFSFESPESILNLLDGLVQIVPMVLFTLTAIDLIIAIFGLIFKKYNKTFNLIFSLFICVLAVAIFFLPYIDSIIKLMKAAIDTGIEADLDLDFVGYFMDIAAYGQYLVLAGAIWGLLQFIVSLVFMKSMKIKNKEQLQ